jgi:hypothetical protein
MTPALLADPIAEARRIIELAESDGVVLRALGGVAVCLQAPDGAPRLPRRSRTSTSPRRRALAGPPSR